MAFLINLELLEMKIHKKFTHFEAMLKSKENMYRI